MNGRKISFDGWVLDRESGDLRRDGNRQRLQELPLKVLDLLLANPGGLVTREQLISHLWPKGIVDFDTGINTAVRKLRVALADVADAPRYIETIPRRGYRFVGTVDPDPPSAAEPIPLPLGVPPAEEAASGNEVLPVEGNDAGVPNLPIQEPARDTALLPDLSGDRSLRQAESEPKLRRRPLLGIAVTVGALCIGMTYWLSHRPAGPGENTASVPAMSLPDQSVAVLPFESLSTEANNEFLAMGIAETVLHRLGGLRDLTVIARTSSFVFKNRNEDVRQIGRALNARYLVQGSVQRAGERLRVQAQLIDAATGKQLWSLAFDRPLADIFALQDEISSRVAEQLSVSLAPGKLAPNDAKTAHLDAYLSYLQGQALISTGKIADARLAIQFFDRAAQMDPQFAAAYAQESRAITRLANMRESHDPEDLHRATALNDKALTLDPELGEAWVQRAGLLLEASGEKDLAEAEKAYRKGLDLAPNYGQGFEEFADFLAFHDRTDDALAMIERARQVDPLMPRNHYLKGVLLDEANKDQREVEALYLQALKLNPTYHPALVRLGWVYEFQGEYAKGLMLQEKAVGIDPEAMWARGATAAAYLGLGDVAAAQDVLGADPGGGGGVKICVLSLNGDHVKAVEMAYELFAAGHPDVLPQVEMCASAEMFRDALATGHFDRALRAFEFQYSIHSGKLGLDAQKAFVWGVPMAHLLLAKGDSMRGKRLAQSILAATDQDGEDVFSQALVLLARAGACAVLGESDRALEALEKATALAAHVAWIIIDANPTFGGLKQDQRYQRLAATMAEKLHKQVELVAKMRTAHELPERPARVVSAN
jgi:TolB-like protein/DNA-binding winged helix-turn-helix (wHTH) protein/Tfp pilus assembly protein PilF